MAQAGVLGRAAGDEGVGQGKQGKQHTDPWPATLPPPPACPFRGPSGFHQVSQQSGCDIMRQAGVSRVTSCGPNVWKSPNQNDPTDRLETEFSKRAPSITKRHIGQALLITASPRTTWGRERSPAPGSSRLTSPGGLGG